MNFTDEDNDETFVGATTEKPGDDKLLKKSIELFSAPEMETFLFTPEDPIYSREVCDHNKTIDCLECDKEISVGFKTKDSGQRQEFSTGMVRDTNTNKPRYDLIWQPGLKRLAELMARGAAKYNPRNWEKASTQEELDRFIESAARHFHQWMQGELDEDHMSATIFNLFGAEMVKGKLK